MTEKEYNERYSGTDHLLIRMTDSFPFFKEKVYHIDGKDRIETNYHIADGVYSTYINFELSDNGLSAEISGCPNFEVTTLDLLPILVTNVGTRPFDIRINSGRYGCIRPGEVFSVHPFEETEVAFSLQKRKTISQSEIDSLLSGDI